MRMIESLYVPLKLHSYIHALQVRSSMQIKLLLCYNVNLFQFWLCLIQFTQINLFFVNPVAFVWVIA